MIPVQARHSARSTHAHTLSSQACMIRAYFGALKTADYMGKLHATCACHEHGIITLIPEFQQPTIPIQTRHSARSTHAHTLPSQAYMIRAHIGALKTSDSVMQRVHIMSMSLSDNRRFRSKHAILTPTRFKVKLA